MKSEDIARLAGVSRSTVSRVINNYSNVPEATREKVMKIVKEHNYMPNTFARTLAGKKSNTIGLFFVITGETREDSKIARNDYFMSYLSHLVDIANGMGYYVLVNTISEGSDYEKVNQAFFEKRVDGGVVIGTQSDTMTKIQTESFNAPIVAIDYDDAKADAMEHFYVVNSDDEGGMIKAVQYLVELGHRDIGFIKGNDQTRSSIVRYDGFVKAMADMMLTVNPDYIISGEFSTSIARDNILKAIEADKLPTAYISSNDYMALEIIKVLQESGYDVPGDIAVIGFDDVHLSEQSNPPLTTLSPRFHAMAKKAIEMIDTALTSEIIQDEAVSFEVDLIMRGSCVKSS